MFGIVATGVNRTTAAVSRNGWFVGGLFIVIGIFVVIVFGFSVAADVVSTYRLSGGGDPVQLPAIPLPTQLVNLALGFIMIAAGFYQIVRGFKRANLVLGLVFALFVVAFLTWSIRGASLNFTGMLESTLLRSIPFLLGALSGILCERVGIINIAIEGMILCAAFISVLVTNLTGGNMWLGTAAGLGSGVVLAGALAVLSIRFRVNQIIGGTVINIFVIGFTNFLDLRIFEPNPGLNDQHTFPAIPIPVLSNIPVLGTIVFDQNWIVYAALILVVVVNFVLYSTRWGLRLRAVGEHPRAADTLGINVNRTRYINVLIAGIPAALAGVFLTLGSVGRFNKLMSNGRGFIALAAVIFGNWTPFGAFAAALIFGFADSLQVKLQILTSAIPSDFLLMAPYIATMIVLAGVVGRVKAPAAEGIPYEKH